MQVLGIAIYECRLIIRERVFWVLSALLTALAWVLLEWPLLPYKDPFTVISTEMEFLGLLGSFLIIFLVVPACLREFQTGFDMVWARSFSHYSFLIGKILGTAIAITAAHLPAIALICAVVIRFFGFRFLTLLSYMCGVALIPTVAITFAVSMLVSLLARHRLLAYIILIMLRAGITTQVDILQLGNIALQGFYTSSVVRFGPDSSLVFTNRKFYALLTCVVLTFTSVLFPLLLPRRTRLGILNLIALTMVTLALLVGVSQEASDFQEAVSRSTLRTPSVSPAPHPTIEVYTLNVVVDLDDEFISGQAEINLHTNSEPLSELSLGLNPGLRVLALEVEGGNGYLEGDKVLFDTPIPSQQSIKMILRYEGTILVSHDAYNSSLPREYRSALPGGYLGQQTFYLTYPGNWYPFSHLGAPANFTLSILGEPNSTIVSSASQTSLEAGKQNFIWSSPLPSPLFALTESNNKADWPNVTVLMPPAYEHIAHDVILAYVDSAFKLDQELQRLSGQPLQAVVLPLIRQSLYDSKTGTLFLSETVFQQYRMNFYYANEPRQSIYHRWATESMIRIWWCQAGECLPTPPFIGFAYEAQGDAVTETLLSYLALRLAEPYVGGDFIVREIQERITIRCSPELYVNSPYPYLGISPSSSLFIRLHRLWERVGPEKFWEFTGIYQATYGKEAPTLLEFEAFTLSATGLPLPAVDECAH